MRNINSINDVHDSAAWRVWPSHFLLIEQKTGLCPTAVIAVEGQLYRQNRACKYMQGGGTCIVVIFVFGVKSQKSLFISNIHYLSGNWRDIIKRSLRHVLSWGQLVSVALSKNHVLLWGQERGGKRKHILFTFVAFLKTFYLGKAFLKGKGCSIDFDYSIKHWIMLENHSIPYSI